MNRSWRLIVVILAMLALGCGGNPPAFTDGLTLVYDAPATGECLLTFSSADGGLRATPGGPDTCPLRPDGLGEDWIVDGSGRHQRRLVWWGELAGEFGPLWLPTAMREVGTHRIGQPIRITEQLDWEGRQVAVMLQSLGPLEVKTYYDLESGFMAGVDKRFGGGWNRILVLKDIRQS